jgi:hypothetical protein
MADQAEVLEDDPDATPERRQVLARRFAQFLVEQFNPPSRWPLREVEELQQRSLSRARWPGEKIEGPLRQTKIEIAQHFRARSVTQAHTIEFGYRRQCSLSSPLGVATGGPYLAKPDSFLFSLPSPSRKRAFAR